VTGDTFFFVGGGGCFASALSGFRLCPPQEQMAAALVAASRGFHEALEDAASRGLVGIACHSIRSDATNSNIWHQSKLFGCELSSCYLRHDVSTYEEFCCASYRMHSFTDCQRVLGSSAEWTHAMLRKQCKGLGMPLWRSGPGNIATRADTCRGNGMQDGYNLLQVCVCVIRDMQTHLQGKWGDTGLGMLCVLSV
jgi:hypothetical protein